MLIEICIAGDTHPPQYSHYDPITTQHLFCDQCPSGTYVHDDCTLDRETQCRPCPRNHYSDTWNPTYECQFCNAVCKELQYVKQECNSTHNKVCECVEGHYLYFEFCVAHTKCPPGYGTAQAGTPETDSVCKKCPKGTFSDVTSAYAVCQPHTDCEKQGLRTKTTGDYENDAVCEENAQESTHTCDLDISLCEEALFRLPVDLPNWITLLAQGLPGKKVTAQQTEWIKQSYDPKDQPFYLFKIWKAQNIAHYSSYPFIQGEDCRNYSSIFLNLNLPGKDITGLVQGLQGKKIDQTDLENAMKKCDPSKQILKLLSLWREKNNGNTINALNLLKTRNLKKALRRRMKKLKLLLNGDSMYKLHQKFLETIVNQTRNKNGEISCL
uniref:TNF receptor superfamily member 11b n=1 Tax=Leptobrachium leishanense TaxID=445787 RepID=A0A8C5MK29_9ANUR